MIRPAKEEMLLKWRYPQDNDPKTSAKCYDVFFSTTKCAFYFKKMLFWVCFLKMFRPLKGWYVLF